MDPLLGNYNNNNNQLSSPQPQPSSSSSTNHHHHQHQHHHQLLPSPDPFNTRHIQPNHHNPSVWPSSPLIKPHQLGGINPNPPPSNTNNNRFNNFQNQLQQQQQQQQNPVIWPNRANPSAIANQKHIQASHREPRSPTREESRRPSHHNQSSPSPSASPHPSPSVSNPRQSNQQNKRNNTTNKDEQLVTRIRVTGIERNRRDLYVKFDAWSPLITSRAGHCPNVSRAYREFVAFHETIAGNNPHTIPPPIPFPNTSAPNPADDDRLVASSFQQFFDRLLLDPSLRTDDELRCFLESDFGYTPQTKTKRRVMSGSSWLTGNKSNHTTVRTLPSSTSQPGGGPETVVSVLEEDELSNAKLQFRLLEERLLECSRAVEQLSRAKRNHSGALLELSSRLVQFSTTESYRALSNGFKRLSQAIKTVSEVEHNGSIGYLVTLSDGLSWCGLSSKAAKEVLRNRTGVLQEHYSSVKKSIEKRRNIERIKSSSTNPSNINPERIEAAIEELESAKKQEDLISQKANLISKNLRPALRIHSKHLHEDLVYSLMENARTQLIYEKQILKELERLKPELDSISLRPSEIIYETNFNNNNNNNNNSGRGGVQRNSLGGEEGDDGEHRQRMIKTVGRTGEGNGNSNYHNHRVSEISKQVVGTSSRSIENLDSRQTVDAKSAAASLARLF